MMMRRYFQRVRLKALRYLAADDADGVALEAGWLLMAFCSLAARPKGLEGLVVLSL